MALRRRLRCPSGTPSSLRSTSVSSGRISASISLARKRASYRPRPRLLSQPPTSMAALHGPERIIVRLKRPVQGRAAEELGWVVMAQRHSERFLPPSLKDRCGFREATFAGTRANGRHAPIPDLPAGRRWNIKLEEMGSVDYTVDLHRMTAPNVSIRAQRGVQG